MLGEQEAAGIVEWIKRKAGPSLVLLEEVDEVAAFVNLHNVAVVGFFQVRDILCFYALLKLPQARRIFSSKCHPYSLPEPEGGLRNNRSL